MDPLTACLLLSFVVMKVFKVAKVDSQYARQGITPPSTSLVQKWLDGRIAKGKTPAGAKPARYGMGSYFAQLWFALWEDLGDRHREQRDTHKRAMADAKANNLPVPAKPSLADRVKAGWQWLIRPVGEPAASSGGAEPAPAAAGGAADPAPMALADVMPAPAADIPPSDRARTACEDCGQTLTEKDGQWTHPSSSGCPRNPAATDPAGAPAAGTDQGNDQGNDQGTEPTEGDSMTQATQQSGEVIGLTSAIAYAEAVAAAHQQHSTAGGEAYMTSLGTANVGPETIQSAGEAMEASANAAGAWQSHAAKLKEQLAAKEATTQETGTKEFLLSE